MIIKKYHPEWKRDPKKFDFFYGHNLLTSAIRGGNKEVVNKILSLYVRLGPLSLEEAIIGYYSAKAMLSTICFEGNLLAQKKHLKSWRVLLVWVGCLH